MLCVCGMVVHVDAIRQFCEDQCLLPILHGFWGLPSGHQAFVASTFTCSNIKTFTKLL